MEDGLDASDSGWIKSYRKRLEEGFSRCPIKYVVWDFLLLNATHRSYEARLGKRPVLLQPGQLITSQQAILKQFDQKLVKVTRDHVRGALDLFVREGMITIDGDRKGTVITILNWGKYQGKNAPENGEISPQQFPNTIPQHETQQNHSVYAEYSEDSTNSFPNTEDEQFPTTQEDNKYTTNLSSNNNIGSSVDEPTPKKSASKFQYPDEFEWIWSNKPEREGANPKRKAFHAANARIKQGATWRELAEGMKRYTAFCSAKGWLNTGTVQQMATFFGPDEHFKEKFVVNVQGLRRESTPPDFDDKAWAQDLDGGLI